MNSLKESKTPLERGFHFITVLWGERYRNYFLEYCLPSLLSPGNIPALRTLNTSKFLIATRPEDWEGMRGTLIFGQMEQFVTPIFFEIPPCPPERSGCEHMGIGHKLCCEQAFQEQAYAMILTPDCMLSDGTVARLQEFAADGAELVLAAAIRYAEEPFLGKLQDLGLIPQESRRDSGRSLNIDARSMVSAAIYGLHSQSLRYEWDAPYFYPQLSPAVWWRVPAEEGIILHSMSWAPLLLDYKAVRKHDTSTLDSWTIDGDYLYKNLPTSAEIRVIDDSDDAFLASWSPQDDQAQSLKPNRILQLPYIGEFLKRLIFYDSFNGPLFDPFKRRIFLRPVYWHSRPLNDKWNLVESRAARTLSEALKSPQNSAARFALSTLRFPLRIGIVTGQFWAYRRSAMIRFREIIRGDTVAARRAITRLCEFATFIIGMQRY